MAENGKLFPNLSQIAERSWKERVRSANEQEQCWVAEALPTSVLEDELRKRTNFMADTIGEYLKLSIKVHKEEQRRLGVI